MMTLQRGVSTLALVTTMFGQFVACGESKNQPSTTTASTGGGSATGDASPNRDWSYLSRLDVGYFKENCTMGFDISGQVFSSYSDTVGKTLAFQGDILGNPDFTQPSGLFTLRITTGGKEFGANFVAGKYTLVKWFDFTGGTVAYRVANKNLSTDGGSAFDNVRDTQADAERDFTDENGYFEVYCCPYANHYPELRLVGSFKASNGPQGFVAQHVPDPGDAGKGQLFQFTAYDDLASGAVHLRGTIGRTNDLTAPSGYWRIQVTDPGSSGFTMGQYTVAAWRKWDGSQVQLALPEKAGSASTVVEEKDALLTFTEGAGYFTFDTTYDMQK